MTKTQQMLLDKARANGGWWQVESGGGRGPKGGVISYGSRERRAVYALEAAGLVKIIGRDSGDIWMGNGNQIRSTVVSFQVV